MILTPINCNECGYIETIEITKSSQDESSEVMICDRYKKGIPSAQWDENTICKFKSNNTIQELHTNASFKGRKENIKGKDYAIYPVVLLVEGVHQAANGKPVYYSPEVLQESVVYWEGMPIPVGHPNVNGSYVRANNPHVDADWVVGRIYNAEVSDGKLKAEAWINVKKADKVSPGLIALLDSGANMEVSTGIMVEGDGKEGNWGMEPFVQTLTKIIPDHLALLPNDTGACSWKDGCGIRANQKSSSKNSFEKNDSSSIIENNCRCNADKEQEEDMATDKLDFAINQLFALEEESEKLMLLEDMALEFLGLKKQSFGDIERAIRMALDAEDAPSVVGGNQIKVAYSYLREVYDTSVVYEEDSPKGIGLFQRSYQINDDGSVTLGDDIIKVKQETKFVPIINKQEEEDMSDKKKCCPEKVDAVIANENSAFTEVDREFLENMEEAQMDKLFHTVTANAKKEDAPTTVAPVINAAPTSAEDFIKSAPPEIQAVLTAGMSQLAQKRTTHIAAITANAKNPFTAEVLAAMDMTTLEHIAALATPVDYSVQGVGSVTANATGAEEPYVSPSLDMTAK